jgi:hypothetical protein
MMRFDPAKTSARVPLCSIVLAGFLATAGCSEPTSADKKDDPALKASMAKSLEIYKSKTPPKKAPPPSLKRQQ